MEFRTHVSVAQPPFQIEPLEQMLFVGSCFADSIGQRFVQERFQAVVNPYGTMYNPASVCHTIERHLAEGSAPRVIFITLGTNHVYRLKSTGEIVDNCQKRPQRLFTEEELSISEVVGYLERAVSALLACRSDVQIVLTVSPIRYQKYGFHESQLSKAVLLLAVDQFIKTATLPVTASLHYFPAYELVLDELRDYRFFQTDMLHPSAQAVDYIWEQLVAHYLSPRARQFLQEWKPIREALAHRPFHPESEEYQHFLAKARQQEAELIREFTIGLK